VIKPWAKIRSEMLANYRVFSVRTDVKVSPRTGKEHDFFVIESVNWVNVIPVTANNELVMIEQYRHGSNTVELEIPGGMMDSTDASPILAGTRELREETGYEGEQAQIIGQIFPNPAIMSNTCFTLLVKNCQLKHATEFDHSEDLVTRLVPVIEIPKLVGTGVIKHSLVVVALYHFDLWQRGLGSEVRS
jgi:ADP-ribose pyrophosphatase